MTTTLERRDETPPDHDDSRPNRRAQWWAGWRVALRLARRDVRRHRGRSTLIVLMIGLPVVLLTFGATLAMTADRTVVEDAPYAYGSGQAVVTGPQGGQFEQNADGSGSTGSTDKPALPVPGFERNRTAAIAALLGQPATPFTSFIAQATVGGERISGGALAITLTPDANFGQRAHLVSGRWPTGGNEVVVTRYGLDLGLPSSGSLEIKGAPDGEATSANGSTPTTRTVVGVADAVIGGGPLGTSSLAAFVVPFSGEASSWIIGGDKPIAWPEVQQLNHYALAVTSRAVMTLPADELAVLNPDSYGWSQTQNLQTVIAAASGALLLTTTLLAGPAFAVSASRQRRTLALAAANGGTVAQVRRFVLGQAVVLGSVATVLGVALGLGAFLALRALNLRQLPNLTYFSPDVPWSLIGLVVVVALVSAVVAALIPARSLGRLDIVRVLRGQEVSQPLRHRLMVAGLVLCGGGALTALTQTVSDSGVSVNAFLLGSGLLTMGALCLVPALLVVSARVAGRLPLTMRMAARDSARQRSRTAPTVAAVLATTALFSASLIGLASDTAKRADTYVPDVAIGLGRVEVGVPDTGVPPTQSQVSDLVTATAPGLRLLHLAWLGDPYGAANGRAPQDAQTVASQRVAAMRSGCSAKQALQNLFERNGDTQCESLSTDISLRGGQVRVLPGAELAGVLRLTPAQVGAVKRGAIVLPDPKTRPNPPRRGTLETVFTAPVDVVDGTVSFASQNGTHNQEDDSFTPTSPAKVTRLPALLLPSEQFLRLQSTNGVGAVMATEGVTRAGWTSTPENVGFYSPAGPVDLATQQRLQAAFESRYDYANVTVGHAFERDDRPVVLSLIGVLSLLVLVATFVSTALSLAEQQPLMGTLAAVGATRGTRRRMAAAQALHLSAVGALIGAAVGLVPGIAISRAATTAYEYTGESSPNKLGPFLEIPWLQIAAPVVLVPLIAAGFAWLAVRRSPEVTRRLS